MRVLTGERSFDEFRRHHTEFMSSEFRANSGGGMRIVSTWAVNSVWCPRNSSPEFLEL